MWCCGLAVSHQIFNDKIRWYERQVSGTATKWIIIFRSVFWWCDARAFKRINTMRTNVLRDEMISLNPWNGNGSNDQWLNGFRSWNRKYMRCSILLENLFIRISNAILNGINYITIEKLWVSFSKEKKKMFKCSSFRIIFSI